MKKLLIFPFLFIFVYSGYSLQISQPAHLSTYYTSSVQVYWGSSPYRECYMQVDNRSVDYNINTLNLSNIATLQGNATHPMIQPYALYATENYVYVAGADRFIRFYIGVANAPKQDDNNSAFYFTSSQPSSVSCKDNKCLITWYDQNGFRLYEAGDLDYITGGAPVIS